jgi:DivIVA domain-containing protein
VAQDQTRRQSPASIRNEVFGHRMRGLDEDEVRDYLDLLADQVEKTEEHLTRTTTELEELREENARLRKEVARATTESQLKAVALLREAQQIADQVVEEAVVRARDLMISARGLRGQLVRRTPPMPADEVSMPLPRIQSSASLGPLTGPRPDSGDDAGGCSIYDQLWRIRGLPRV